MQELKKALAEDWEEIKQELPLFLWHMLPSVLGLIATCWVASQIQNIMG